MNTISPCRKSARVSASRVAALAAAMVLFAPAGHVMAAPCMADAAGETGLNCTANDLGIASVSVTNIIDGCTAAQGDTFTFDGLLNVNADSTTRYDLGFYIGADGLQALTGTCSVTIVPPALADEDGDLCGDHPGSALSVPLSGATAACVDSNGDGFLDLAICTSYDNNSNTVCNGPADAIPGTGAKCQCLLVPTDLQIHCSTNAECETDNNVCTDEVCNSIASGLGDIFGCSHDPNTQPCDDGLFCNGVDVCTGGTCGHAGDPCAGGGICGNECNELADNCFVDAGTLCRASAGVCDVPENCTGSSLTCPADGFASTATSCRASAGVCDVAENCTGASAACPANGFASSATVCRASTGQCDVAENCTGSAAACPPEASTDGLACNDGLFCTEPDVCTAAACGGPARSCADNVDCSVDSCNETSNACEHTADDAACDDGDACTEGTCSVFEGCSYELICRDICRSAGYWSTHSGYEKEGAINVGQLVLDTVGPLEVCGQVIGQTSNTTSPYLEGLGLTSDLEGLCMRTKGVQQRQLYRQLTAAALNCAITGADCDDVLAKYVDVTFSDCSELCETLVQVPSGPSVGECKDQLDCFNNGGRLEAGRCALGTCAEEPGLFCGEDYGSCPDFELLPQECVRFEGNCHSNALCNEELEMCPKGTRASSPKACNEAKFNSCTIDSCN